MEQNCIYLDMDDLDQNCWHLCGWENGVLLAYCRLVPPNLKYREVSIGRVLTTKAGRGRGLGRELFTEALSKAEQYFPSQNLRIGAQYYLEKFYASFGFKTITEPYDEDGIDHVDMLLDKGGQ